MGFFGNIDATMSISTDATPDPTVPEPANADLTQAEFEALTWTPVPNMVSGPDTGGSTSFVERQVWDERFNSAFKGSVSGNEGTIVLAVDDAAQADGRVALGAASAAATNAYALKFEWPTGRVEYGRFLIGEPTLTKGAKEDPPEETFATKVVQLPVIDDGVA